MGDRLGLGLFWGAHPDRAQRSETGAEIYWKMQITPAIEITPGLQINFSPVQDPERSLAWIGELRLRVVL